jgi:NNP family nitrate/nitrite transporter-like MFS transporter
LLHRIADGGLWGFFIFYASCAALTWWIYTRRGGLLHDIERGRTPAPASNLPPERSRA